MVHSRKNTVQLLGAVFIVVILALLIIFAFGSIRIVPPGNRGIVVTLGKVSPYVRDEGVVFKLPFVQTVRLMSIRQETKEGMAECFSSDLQTVIIKFDVLLRIPAENVAELYQKYAGDYYDSLIAPRVQEAAKQVTAKYRAEEIVKSREIIKTEIVARMQAAMAGLIRIVDVTVTNIDLTPELEKAIEQKVKMEQLALAKKFELQREETEAQITVVRATAEAEGVRIRGEALKSSPDVITLEMIKKWNGKTPDTIVTSGNGLNFILPLDKHAEPKK